jgi:hypothetical protein
MADFGPTIAVPFMGGLDTKTDSKLTPVGKLQVLENGIFTENGSIRKRWGYTSMVPVSLSGTEVSRARSLASWNSTPLLTSSYDLYAKVGSKWDNVGSFPSMSVSDVTVPHVVGQQEMGDFATNGTVTVYAWEDSRGGVRASVVDADSGAIHIHDYEVDSAGAIPRCSVTDGIVLLIFSKSSTNEILSVPIGNGDPSGDLQATPVQITNDMLASETYDVHHEDGRTFVAWTSSDAGAGLKVADINSAGGAIIVTSVNVVTLYTVTIANIVHLSLNLMPDADSSEARIAVVGTEATGGSGFAVELFEDSLSFDSGAAYTPGSAGTINNLSIYPQLGASSLGGGSTFDYFISYEIDATDDWDNYVVTEEQDGTTWSTIRHSCIASRGRLMDDRGYLMLNHTSPGLQHAYFLYDMYDKIPVSRVAYGLAGATYSKGQLPGLFATDESTMDCALLLRRRISSLGESFKAGNAGNSTFQNTELGRYSFDLSAKADYTEAGSSTYFASGTLLSFDGVAVEESAPFLFPEDVTLVTGTPSTHSDGLVAGATYLYRVYYERTRANGEQVRSLALTFRKAVGASDTHMEITVPMLSHTMATAEGDWRIAIYRTEANRTQQFYEVTSPDLTDTSQPNEYIPNDPTADVYTFDDDMDDATLVTNRRCPQSEGVIPVVQPAGCSIVGWANDRAFLAGGEGLSSVVYPSLVHFPGEPLLFSDELQFSVEEEGGEIVAMGAIDGVLVVFKERRIYAVSGDGLSDVGTGQPFSVQRVTTDVGCSNGGSVVETPAGLMFQSAKGIYILTRSFETKYIGWPVESLSDVVLVSAEVIPDTNLVVFLTSSGNTLAYDYLFDQWTSFTGHAGLSSVVIGSDFHYLRSDGEMYTRDEDTYLDAGSWYALRLRTAPIRLSSVQDYLQVRRVNILGEYLSSHRLQMLVWCNRDLAPFETRVFEVDDVVDTTEWGDADTDLWGDADPLPWGGQAGESDYQFQHKFKRQKVQSIRLEFQDLRTDGAPGQSYELAEMNFEIGVHDGNARVPARRKV